MSPMDDVGAEMRGFRFDEATVDAFWGGRVAPDDAPRGYQELASLVRAARAPASADELIGQTSVVAAAAAAVRAPAGIFHGIHWAGPRPLAKLVSFKVAKLVSFKVVAAAAAVGLGGGLTAAAAGVLPAPIQSAVSDGLSHLGISIPNPDHHASPHVTPGAATAYRHAADTYGLCTAYAASAGATSTDSHASGAHLNPTGFAQLTAAAQAQGQTIQQFCANLTAPPSQPTDTPSDRHTGSPSGPSGGTPSSPPSRSPSGPPSRSPSSPPSRSPSSPPSSSPSGPPRGDRSGPNTDRPSGPRGDDTEPSHPGNPH